MDENANKLHFKFTAFNSSMHVPVYAECIYVLAEYLGRNELPSGVEDGAPVGNAFWRILKVTERSFLYLYADALSSSNRVLCYI